MDWTWVRIGSVLVLLLAVSQPAEGQDVRFGLRAGTSVSSFYGDADDLTAGGQLDLSPVLGPVLTGSIEVQQGRWIVPRVELTYVRNGAAVHGRAQREIVCIAPPCPDSDIRVDRRYRISYLKIPTIGAVRFPIFDRWASEIVVGQYLGVTLQSNVSQGNAVEPVRKTTYGLLAGGALEYAVGAGNAIAFDARYSRALTSLSSQGDLQGLRIDGVTVGLKYLFAP